ncbi:hypothetical protein J4462_03885 [Candidatus Pacearchaeota archaeon]|nr:hypothetical protein [Candidatus Pacearchaeota archaeon]
MSVRKTISNILEGMPALSLIPPRKRYNPLLGDHFVSDDTEALRRDWKVVGEDLAYAIKKYKITGGNYNENRN